MSDDRFKCGCCNQPKLNLESRSSQVTGMKILFCKTCIAEGFEPRELLIIAYASASEALKRRATRLIKGRKYVGEEITLAEIL